MRIAFVSDIHANLQAWNAVHADLAAQRVDRIICLGDVVGYGPSPAEVLTRTYASVNHFVLGNHDAVVSGFMQPTGFNPNARNLIDLTRQRLGQKAEEFFRKVPLSLKSNGLRCAHGNPANPGGFGYVLDESDAKAVWQNVSEDLCFVGHTHRPCLHVLAEDGTYTRAKAAEAPMSLRPGQRYIVNCGSVGMSRDSDFRSSYVVYDTAQKNLQWHRVAYDLDAFTRTVRETFGETEPTRFLLKRFDSTLKRPVRELIDFTPGQATISDSVAEEEEIEQIKARVIRWQVAAAVVCLLLVLCTVGFGLFWSSLPKPLTLTGPQTSLSVQPVGETVSQQCIPNEEGSHDRVPPGWKVLMSDSRTQSFRFTREGLSLTSTDERHALEVALPRLDFGGSSKVRLKLHGGVADGFQGEPPVLVVDYVYKNGELRHGVRSEPLVVTGSELSKQHTLSDIPNAVQAFDVRLRGRFCGEVRIDSFVVTAYPEAAKEPGLLVTVNVNTASLEELCALPGIGETRARGILEHREKEGPFRTPDDLLEVKGIGKSVLGKMREHVRVAD